MASDEKEIHYIWEKIVTPVHDTVLEECSSEFQEQVGLYFRGEDSKWCEEMEIAFHHWRHIFKEQCYGKREDRKGNPLMDNRKVAAVLCQTFLVCKPFGFDLESADKLGAEKKAQLSNIEYTKWAVNHTLINYKFSYLASQQLVYLTLLADLAKPCGRVDEMVHELNKVGHLFRYPVDSESDSMDTNIIVGLARGDISGQELNMLLYAMLLYQNEMYTRERLKAIVNSEKFKLSSTQ